MKLEPPHFEMWTKLYQSLFARDDTRSYCSGTELSRPVTRPRDDVIIGGGTILVEGFSGVVNVLPSGQLSLEFAMPHTVTQTAAILQNIMLKCHAFKHSNVT